MRTPLGMARRVRSIGAMVAAGAARVRGDGAAQVGAGGERLERGRGRQRSRTRTGACARPPVHLPLPLADPALARALAAALDVEGKILRALEALGPIADRELLLLEPGHGARAAD